MQAVLGAGISPSAPRVTQRGFFRFARLGTPAKLSKIPYVRDSSCYIDDDIGMEAGGYWIASPKLKHNGVCIHQGCVTVRGLLKAENQDRLVAAELGQDFGSRSYCMPSSDGPTGEAAQTVSRAPVICSAVFDGHGGVEAATHAQDHLQRIIKDNPTLLQMLENSCGSCSTSTCQLEPQVEEQLRALLADAFLRLDTEICEKSRDCGLVDGAAAIAGFHAGPCLIVANAGDCRAVLSRAGEAIRLSCDHKPNSQSERTRIEAEGGRVQHVKGAWRVLLPSADRKSIKMLATSRGLGDLHFKDRRLVSCEPDVTSTVLLPHMDAFSIFASDGLWGFVDDQEAVETVLEVIDEFSHMSIRDMKAAADAAARKLIKLAVDSGSTDDVTVIVNIYDWQNHG